MSTLLQVKISDEMNSRLNNLLTQIRQAYAIRAQDLNDEARRAAMNAKGKEEGDLVVENFSQSQRKLRALGLRISMQNIVRLFLEAGLDQYEHEITRLLESVGEHGVTRGRPTGT